MWGGVLENPKAGTCNEETDSSIKEGIDLNGRAKKNSIQMGNKAGLFNWEKCLHRFEKEIPRGLEGLQGMKNERARGRVSGEKKKKKSQTWVAEAGTSKRPDAQGVSSQRGPGEEKWVVRLSGRRKSEMNAVLLSPLVGKSEC